MGPKHAICVVDDLIFDPACRHPLKLNIQVLNWIAEVKYWFDIGLHFTNPLEHVKRAQMRQYIHHHRKDPS